MRIVLSLVFMAGLLMTQGCCWIGVVAGLKMNSTEVAAQPKKEKTVVKASVKAPVKVKLSQEAKDLSQVADTTQTAEGIMVKLKGDVLFEKGKNELNGEAANKIREIASVLKKYSQTKVTVIGHTDNIGSEKANQLLSEKRAASVKAELVKGGLPEGNVSSVGKGDTQPVAPNDTPANRAKNRRAVLKIENLK